MFTNFYTTINGQRHIARSMEDGKKLVLTKSVFGKGVLPAGTYPVSAESLVSKLGDMTFKVKEASDTEFKITTNFSNYINKKILPAFHLTEMGIYGKIQNSDGSTDAGYPEKLIFYGCCSQAEADYIPEKLTEFIINWSVAVAGEATIESVIEDSLVYASQSDMKELDKATFDGYHKSIGNSYSGPAGNYGIEIGKIEGKSVQDGTPTPTAPAEIKSFGDSVVNFVSRGFQLFDASRLNNATGGEVSITNNKDGSFTVNGSGTLTVACGTQYYLEPSVFLQLFKVGTLTLKTEKAVCPFVFVNLYKDGSFVRTILSTKKMSSTSVELTEEYFDGTYSIAFGITGNVGDTVLSGTVKPMLYQDGDGTWEPFREPQSVSIAEPLRSLPNGVCDTYEDGKITRRVGMLSLHAQDAWSTSTSYENTYYVRKPEDMKYASVILCDKYRYATIDTDKTQDKVTFTGNFINFKDSDFANVDEFKTWLASNPITVFYELATPIIEEVTLPTIPSYAPHTSVHHDSDVEPPSIEWHVLNGVPAEYFGADGILDIEHGGTGGSTAEDARENLGILLDDSPTFVGATIINGNTEYGTATIDDDRSVMVQIGGLKICIILLRVKFKASIPANTSVRVAVASGFDPLYMTPLNAEIASSERFAHARISGEGNVYCKFSQDVSGSVTSIYTISGVVICS